MSIIEKIVKQTIYKFSYELERDENKNKIRASVIQPLLIILSNSIINEFYPFILFGSTIFVLTFIFALIIMILIIKKN